MTARNTIAFVAVFVLFSAHSSLSTAATIVHEWKFEDNLVDTSGSGNDGTATGAPGFIAGKFGQAINIGPGERVDNLAANNLPVLAGDEFSLNMWYNRDTDSISKSYMGGIGTRVNTPGTNRSVYSFGTGGDPSNGIYFYSDVQDISTGTPFITDGEWHMITVTGEAVTGGTQVNVYQDAVLIASELKTLSNLSGPQVGVGGDITALSGSYDLGGLDEFTVWSGALSLSNIEMLYANNTLIPEPSSILLAGIALTLLPARRLWRKI